MESEGTKQPAEVEEIEEDEEDEEELEEGENDNDCSEDETPARDESIPVHQYLLDCSYEAIKICNIDFLTDFGSAEPFLIDGDSLVAYALTNPYLNKKSGLQMLHVVHIVETTLARMMERGANFDIFFFEGNAVLWREQDTASALARAVIIQHFNQMNRARELAGQGPLVKVHLLPGAWWDAGSAALPTLVEQCGPSYIVADFGWCGAEGRVLHLTRAFINHLHLSSLHVVTIADFELDGSHILSNNMQPPRHPRARDKFALAVRELLDLHRPWLAAPPPPPAADGPAALLAPADARDPREAVLVAAMRHVAAACADVGKVNAAAMCAALALAATAPLAARCLPFTDEAFERCAPGGGGRGFRVRRGGCGVRGRGDVE
jgi:hypothetical protein